MSTYPRALRVVMGQCPGQGGPTPFFGDGPSQSATRMDQLMPDWRDHALGVNLWWNATDWQWRVDHRLDDIVAETQCELIVGLGTFVHTELGMDRKGELYDVELVPLLTREVLVVRFPHPSGRSRYWNVDRNVQQASRALQDALTAPMSMLHRVAKTPSRHIREVESCS